MSLFRPGGGHGASKGSISLMAAQHNPRPTMRDVATRAGVSFKTVSRVVNREPGVSPDLAKRVQDAISFLGYRPDDRARHLRQSGRQTGAIGFALVDVGNPFFSSTIRGIEEVARRHGYLVLAGSTDGNLVRQDQLIETFVARRVDGIIAVPSGNGLGVLGHEIERGTPVVFLDLEPEHVSVDLVRSDHHGGAVLATKHLLAHGHQDIAFFGDTTEIFSAQLRLTGFRDAMRDAGRDVAEQRVVTGHHSTADWQQIITDYLAGSPAPTAIFSAQNFITVGAAHALHALGLAHKIAHIGFDDIDLADLVQPGISVVPQQPWDLGRQAAELLFQRLAGADTPPVREIISSPVIARGSGEIRPGPVRRSKRSA
jgi:LacI family transcriptional regulator